MDKYSDQFMPYQYITEAAPYMGSFDRYGFTPVYGPEFEEVSPEPSEKKEPLTKLPPNRIGISANPFARPIDALQQRLREGASKVELAFMGAGKGNKQAFTPESIGKVERRALKDLAKINEAEVTTHATTSVMGFSGLTNEGFSEKARYMALKEIAKAIDFAGEATNGGAVVVHTGEFPRNLEESEIEVKNGKLIPKFLSMPMSITNENIEEELAKDRVVYFVDEKTGQVSGVKMDTPIEIPEVEEMTIPVNGGEKLSLQKWKEKKNGMKVKVPVIKEKPLYEIWKEAVEKYKDKIEKGELRPEGALMLYIKQDVLKGYEAESQRFLKQIEKAKEKLNRLLEEREHLLKMKEKFEKEGKKDVWERMYVEESEGPLLPPKAIHKLDAIEKQIEETVHEIKWMDDYATRYGMSKENALKELKRKTSLRDFALEKSADTIARAGIMALEKTKQMKKKEPDFKPLFIAPENLFPDTYGSHPDELATIIEKSRKKMKEYLVKMKKMNPKEAEKYAKQHIKATLDIGHLNLWRQYFRPSEKAKTPEDVDKEFKEWVKKKIKNLTKKGIIGHVHLADNFGYDDEHLSLGQGNAPIKEFLKVIEEAGIDDMIIETGSFNPLTGWAEGLQYLGSPLYGAFPYKTFSNIKDAHFGYNLPPNYIVGAYAPSNEWKLWSDVPFE